MLDGYAEPLPIYSWDVYQVGPAGIHFTMSGAATDRCRAVIEMADALREDAGDADRGTVWRVQNALCGTAQYEYVNIVARASRDRYTGVVALDWRPR